MVRAVHKLFALLLVCPALALPAKPNILFILSGTSPMFTGMSSRQMRPPLYFSPFGFLRTLPLTSPSHNRRPGCTPQRVRPSRRDQAHGAPKHARAKQGRPLYELLVRARRERGARRLGVCSSVCVCVCAGGGSAVEVAGRPIPMSNPYLPPALLCRPYLSSSVSHTPSAPRRARPFSRARSHITTVSRTTRASTQVTTTRPPKRRRSTCGFPTPAMTRSWLGST